MESLRIFVAVVIFAAVFVVSVVAKGQEIEDRSDIRAVSSFVAPGEAIPNECREEAHAFAQILVRYPRPASWHWVLVCDEEGWRRFLRLSGRAEEGEERIYASTDLAAKTTYIRGAKLVSPYDFHADPDDIVAHELAHIRLNSSTESAAAELARLWRKGAMDEGGVGMARSK